MLVDTEKKDKIDRRKEMEIVLDFPVQLADRKLEKVTMRRPVMRDMLKNQSGAQMTLKDTVALIGDLCGLVPDEMELLDSIDFEKLQDQLLAFRGANIAG